MGYVISCIVCLVGYYCDVSRKNVVLLFCDFGIYSNLLVIVCIDCESGYVCKGFDIFFILLLGLCLLGFYCFNGL